MIPTLAIDMTPTLAPFGYAALLAVAVGLIAVVSAAIRAREKYEAVVRHHALVFRRAV